MFLFNSENVLELWVFETLLYDYCYGDLCFQTSFTEFGHFHSNIKKRVLKKNKKKNLFSSVECRLTEDLSLL